MANVSVTGASCRLEPSLTADAIRLGSLSAVSPPALERLLAELPDPPWDVELAPDDDLIPDLLAAGFERYADGEVLARSLEGISAAPAPPGVKVGPYRDDWAEPFSAAEAAAMDGSAIFAQMTAPTGYEEAAHLGGFFAATAGTEVLGFVQATLPQGWINWFGVVPDQRRKGIGRALIATLADAAREQRGTHLATLAVSDGARAFFAAEGFAARNQRTLLLRRPES